MTILITGWELQTDDPRLKEFDLRVQKPFPKLNHLKAEVARGIELHDARSGEKESECDL